MSEMRWTQTRTAQETQLKLSSDTTCRIDYNLPRNDYQMCGIEVLGYEDQTNINHTNVKNNNNNGDLGGTTSLS